MKIFRFVLNPQCQVLGVMGNDDEHVLTTAAFTNDEDFDAAEALTSTLLARLGLLETHEPLSPAPTLPELLALLGLDGKDFVLELTKRQS